MRNLLLATFAVIGLVFATAACGGDTTGGGGDNGNGDYEELVLTAIPDGDEGDMRDAFGAMAKHLSRRIGIPVRYEHATDYRATVVGLARDRVQLAWYGAITTAQAWQQMGDDLRLIACRDIDKQFVAYYIANTETRGLPAEGEFSNLGELADLAEQHGWSLTFGSPNSTSSHAMPHYFFREQSGRSPHNVFTHVGFGDNHDVVRRNVVAGTYNVGTLSDVAWNQRATEEDRQRARVVYRTPRFTNYSLCSHAGLGDELLDKIREAIFALPESEEGRQVLEYLGSETFVEAELDEWRAYVDILESDILDAD